MLTSPETNRYVTAAEFLVHPVAAAPSELVRGTIHVMSPAGGIHGLVAGRVFALINTFVEQHRLGLCFADNTGFELAGLPDTVRSPDAAFVSAARLPREGIGPGWMRATPDLVVEVLSPSETAAELEDKVDDYRTAGTRLFWIVDPATRTVSVRATGDPERRLTESETIDGGDVLPGFTFAIARLFEGLAPSSF
jgi:Uma2 family endonuclease